MMGPRCQQALIRSIHKLILYCIQGRTGGTTVSGTMLAAHWAGIPVFVTGGVGGVHYAAETSEHLLPLRKRKLWFNSTQSYAPAASKREIMILYLLWVKYIGCFCQ